MEKDLLDIGMEFLREYIKATPEERARFTSQINEMACSSDQLLETANKLGEIAKTMKERMTREEANRIIEKHCPCWPNCSKPCDDCLKLSMLMTYGFTDFYGVVINSNGEALEDKED